MTALNRLKAMLGAATTQPLARTWAEEGELDEHIRHLDRYLKEGASPYVPKNLQEEAVKRFWTSKRVDSLKDARLVSYGVALPVGPQRVRVIEDRERFPILLDGVDQFLPAPKQYRRCYQGLLSGYFGYDPAKPDTPQVGRDNWESLRKYLGKRAKGVLDGERNPAWADSLQRHETLLSADPCGRYGPAMLDGKRAEVDELREVLNISDTSWFMRRLFLAQVEAATKRRDPEFLTLLYRVLDLLHANEIVRDEGLALVLDRHARIQPPPLEVPLRDAAVNWWGNPWLGANSMRWGRVTPAARAMVTEWLKLEFIEAFFSLLAEERTGDTRRLEFWKRYVHAIDGVHFALGADARMSRTSDFVALRKKMAGLAVPLQDAVRTNNAFIMQMGPIVIVEFGGYSNACYGYDAKQPLPFEYSRPVVTPVNADNSLKHSRHLLKLRHQDGIHGWGKWEQMFEATLAENFNVRPTNRPVGAVSPSAPPPPLVRAEPERRPAIHTEPPPQQPEAPRMDRNWEIASWKTTTYTRKALSQFAERFELRIEDLTAANGNLWVRTDDSDLGVNGVLLRWEFGYKAGKGWWKKR